MSDKKKDGRPKPALPVWAIVLIVVGCVGVVAAIIAVVMRVRRQRGYNILVEEKRRPVPLPDSPRPVSAPVYSNRNFHDLPWKERVSMGMIGQNEITDGIFAMSKEQLAKNLTNRWYSPENVDFASIQGLDPWKYGIYQNPKNKRLSGGSFII